jgi:hypothetical protein
MPVQIAEIVRDIESCNEHKAQELTENHHENFTHTLNTKRTDIAHQIVN